MAFYLAVTLAVGEGRRQLWRRVRGRLLVEGRRWRNRRARRRLLSLRGVSQVVVPLHVAVAGGLVGVPLEGVQRVVHAAAVVGRGLLQEAEGTLHMTSKVGIPLSYMHLGGRILVDILNSSPPKLVDTVATYSLLPRQSIATQTKRLHRPDALP